MTNVISDGLNAVLIVVEHNRKNEFGEKSNIARKIYKAISTWARSWRTFGASKRSAPVDLSNVFDTLDFSTGSQYAMELEFQSTLTESSIV